eukprot:5243157-Prymnesium_polylepis.1
MTEPIEAATFIAKKLAPARPAPTNLPHRTVLSRPVPSRPVPSRALPCPALLPFPKHTLP